MQKVLFLMFFSEKRFKCKIGKRDGHGKLKNGHGKVMEKYFVKSVRTLEPHQGIRSGLTAVYIYFRNLKSAMNICCFFSKSKMDGSVLQFDIKESW